MTTSVRIVSGRAIGAAAPGAGLHIAVNQPDLRMEIGSDVKTARCPDGSSVFFAGIGVGFRSDDGRLQPIDAAIAQCASVGIDSVAARLEGRWLLVHVAGSRVVVRADAFNQRDLYFEERAGTIVAATSLDLLPVAGGGARPDPMAFAHALAVYGFRPPKRHTFYEGVRRLGVGETAIIDQGRLTLEERPFAPAPVERYADAKLDEYADIMLEAVRARASDAGNVVYLSSGWDSTAILACLVHLFGPSKVRAVTGRMVYAERSGVINQFEIDRAQRMADYFGVKLHVVDFDYRHNAPDQIREAQPTFRPHQMAGITALNHWILAKASVDTGHDGEVLFAGEMSDGAHNLGFSQYATYFHPVVEFREYFDKMAGYLHGPTFLRLLQDGRFADDPVYRLIRERAGATAFDAPAPDAAGRTQQVIASCLLRGVRVPLASMGNCRLLNAKGLERFASEIEGPYLGAAAAAATPETLYAWYLHLYNSLHWQGSTVATIPTSAEHFGRAAAMPFHDARLQAFLGGMPESWGRSLDLRPTKYPLKWMLANRIKYPMDYQTGPHSYLYDVDPTFNHSAEALYGSSMKTYFHEQLRTRPYEAWLSPDVFDLTYVNAMVNRYLEGTEVRGGEMNDLWSLCVLTMTGWYGSE